jgi:putative transposase
LFSSRKTIKAKGGTTMIKGNIISLDNPEGKADVLKEFLAIEDGYQESEQSWAEVLLSLKDPGFRSPKLAVGDGALGFWKVVRKVFSQTRSQRCWVHKTANIMNKLPKHSQGKAKQYIHDIWMAETRENAERAFDLFIKPMNSNIRKRPSALKKIERNS